MPHSKVLVVDSVDDSITRRRHALHAANPILRALDLAYCYAIDPPDEDIGSFLFGLPPDAQLRPDLFFERVEQAISSFQPDYIMFHSGCVYAKFPGTYVEVMARVKRAHPAVRVGIQQKPGMAEELVAYNADPAVKKIHDMLFIL